MNELNKDDEEENEDPSDKPAIKIEPEHFEDDGLLEKYVKKVLTYQRTRISEENEGIEIFEQLPQAKPSKLIPPYNIIVSIKNDECL